MLQFYTLCHYLCLCVFIHQIYWTATVHGEPQGITLGVIADQPQVSPTYMYVQLTNPNPLAIRLLTLAMPEDIATIKSHVRTLNSYIYNSATLRH